MDRLIGAAVGLARACLNHPPGRETDALLFEALSAGSADPHLLSALSEKVRAEKALVAPDCAVCQTPCGSTDDYDMGALSAAGEEVRAAKERLLAELESLAACGRKGQLSSEAADAFRRALCALGEDWEPEGYRPFFEAMVSARPQKDR